MGAEADPDAGPLAQFRRWLDEATTAGSPEPCALTLATVAPDGAPQARMVILRGLDERGLVFYTDRGSPKARELVANPRAALVFWWPSVERQVRISGTVSLLELEETESNFRERPRNAQLAVWIRQSRVIAGRAELEAQFAAIEARYAEREVPLPPHWVGYRVRPDVFEFWAGRPDRLHERVRYIRQPAGDWLEEHLTP